MSVTYVTSEDRENRGCQLYKFCDLPRANSMELAEQATKRIDII